MTIPKMIPESNPTPESRDYIHDRCEQVTTVSEGAFSSMASPLAEMQQTYCSVCKGMFVVSEYCWSDTKEPLPDYYARHGSNATSFDRFIGSRNSILAALGAAVVVGVAATVFFGFVQGTSIINAIFCGIGVTVLSLIGMAVILLSVLTPWAHKRACGVSDPRRLI